MISKKGQVGKVVTSIPVFILIVVIIIVYLFIIASMRVSRAPSLSSEGYYSESGGLILEEVAVSGKNIRVFDKLVSSTKENFVFGINEFLSLLLKEKDSDNTCIIMFENPDKDSTSIVGAQLLGLSYNRYESEHAEEEAGKLRNEGKSEEEILRIFDERDILYHQVTDIRERYDREDILRIYRENFSIVSFKDIRGEDRTIVYYYGGCLNE